MPLPKYLARLNPEQRKAATSIDGFNFVLAGAGSGKTSVLIARIAYMLEQGIDPNNILLITFTNKAAKEMKDRVIALLGERGEKVTACTFHSFCAQILRKHAQDVNIPNDFIVLDESDRKDAMSITKDIYFEMCEKRGITIDLESFPTDKMILDIYDKIVNCSCSVEAACNEKKETIGYAEDIQEILSRFAKYKVEHKALDYEDLLCFVEKLFRQNIAVREKFDAQFKYIMCDEYQDTNPLQNSIINYISQKHPNLMVVGDDNQSIYAFRHADINNILSFKDVHPGCKEFMLTENYRSTQEILDLANAVMTHATEGIEKKLHGQRRGNRPELKLVSRRVDEAEWIIQDILTHNVPRNDIAIICRGGSQTNLLEGMLNRYGIPFNKYGGQKFLEKAVVKDLLAFLRMLHNPKDEIAAMRVLTMLPGVGAKTAKTLANNISTDGFAALSNKKWEKKAFFKYIDELSMALEHLSTLTLSKQLDYLVNDYYYSIRKNAINNSSKSPNKKNEELQALNATKEDANILMDMTASYKSIASFLTDMVLEATHKNEDNSHHINITTIHSAKGLQYHTVYIVDCIDGVTPKSKAGTKEDAEELRCMYVALTRAKERVVLIQPELWGYSKEDEKETKLSHFIRHQNVLNTLKVTRVASSYQPTHRRGYF